MNKSVSKIIAIAAVSAMAFTATGTVPAAQAEGIIKASASSAETQKPYTDVAEDYTHAEAIYIARDYNLLTGYSNGTFKPFQSLTRGNVVKSLGKYILAYYDAEITDFDLSHVKPFNDVPSTHRDQELYNYSLLVRDFKIFTGNENNNLSPNKLIQRQQMAKVLVETFELEDLPGVESKVKDNAKAAAGYRDYINILSENGVTVTENFNPTGTTNRGQFASFLVRSLEASFAMEMAYVIEAVNETTTADDLVDLLDFFFENVEMARMNDYFNAMQNVEFTSFEEIQAKIDAVNAQLS